MDCAGWSGVAPATISGAAAQSGTTNFNNFFIIFQSNQSFIDNAIRGLLNFRAPQFRDDDHNLTTATLLMSGSLRISSRTPFGGTLSRFNTVMANPPTVSRLRLMLAM